MQCYCNSGWKYFVSVLREVEAASGDRKRPGEPDGREVESSSSKFMGGESFGVCVLHGGDVVSHILCHSLIHGVY